MTDKEKAKEYFRKLKPFELCSYAEAEAGEKGYLAGLAERRKENNELKHKLNDLRTLYECDKKATAMIMQIWESERNELKEQNKDLCESLDIMNNRESELLDKINKMKCCGNCKHQKYDYESKYCEFDATREKECVNLSEWELAE